MNMYKSETLEHHNGNYNFKVFSLKIAMHIRALYKTII
jgi:hypothetical protein